MAGAGQLEERRFDSSSRGVLVRAALACGLPQALLHDVLESPQLPLCADPHAAKVRVLHRDEDEDDDEEEEGEGED